MKKLGLFLFAAFASLVCGTTIAQTLFDSQQQSNEELLRGFAPQLLFTANHDRNIAGVRASPDEQMFVSFTQHSDELKVWDIPNTRLLSSKVFKGLLDTAWVGDSATIVALTGNSLLFLNPQLEQIGSVSVKNTGANHFKNMSRLPRSGNLAILTDQSILVLDENARIIRQANFKPGWNSYLMATQDEHHLLVVNQNGSQFAVLDSQDLSLQRNIKVAGKFALHNSDLIFATDSGLGKIELQNGRQTSLKLSNWDQKHRFIRIAAAEPPYLLAQVGKSSYDAKKFIAYRLNLSGQMQELAYQQRSDLNTDNMVLSASGRLMFFINSNQLEIHDTGIMLSTPLSVAAEPAPAGAAVLPAAAAVDPGFTVTASTLQGTAPLRVSFLLDTNVPDQVKGVLTQIEGNRKAHVGLPASIEYVFSSGGSHAAIFALSLNDGTLVRQMLTIEVAEESFEQFKHRVIGK